MPYGYVTTGAIQRRINPPLTQPQSANTPAPTDSTPAQPNPNNPIPPIPPAQSVNDYSFDPAYDAATRALQDKGNQLQSDYDLQKQRTETSFIPKNDALQQQHGIDLSDLSARMADQGMLRSGGNLMAQGRVNDQYQNSISDLAFQKESALEALQRTLTSGQQDIVGQRTTLQAQHARDIATQELARAQKQAELQAAQQAQADLAANLANQQNIGYDAQNAFAKDVLGTGNTAGNAKPRTSPQMNPIDDPQFFDPNWSGPGSNKGLPPEPNAQGQFVPGDNPIPVAPQPVQKPAVGRKLSTKTAAPRVTKPAVRRAVGRRY